MALCPSDAVLKIQVVGPGSHHGAGRVQAVVRGPSHNRESSQEVGPEPGHGGYGALEGDLGALGTQEIQRPALALEI